MLIIAIVIHVMMVVVFVIIILVILMIISPVAISHCSSTVSYRAIILMLIYILNWSSKNWSTLIEREESKRGGGQSRPQTRDQTRDQTRSDQIRSDEIPEHLVDGGDTWILGCPDGCWEASVFHLWSLIVFPQFDRAE